ncbi:Uncharacterised protein [Acinetobacter baumannii]|nr:Uncharacterised protein [Acinetobacter baumannii]
MMVSATPFSSPLRIGRDSRSASAPSLNRLANRHQPPIIAVIMMVNCQWRSILPAASGVTTAAITAQVAASGPTISWRDEPNSA